MATTIISPEKTVATLRSIQPKSLRSERRKVPEAQFEMVDPTTAKRYLQANVHNRDLREARVRTHAATLTREEWKPTPNGIGFDVDGRLIDGQHRLSGIVLADTPALLIVARGLPSEAQDVTDQNLPRKMSDALKLRGEKDWFALAAALGWLYRLDLVAQTGEIHYNNKNGAMRPNTPQLLRVLDKNPLIRTRVARTKSVRREIPIRNGMFAALWLKMLYAAPEQADIFVDALASGVIQYEGEEEASLRPGDPINALRRLLMQRAIREREKFPDYVEAALISKAFVLWIDGAQVGTLAWKYGGQQREAFPIIRGPLGQE